jgi:hypothetical protein
MNLSHLLNARHAADRFAQWPLEGAGRLDVSSQVPPRPDEVPFIIDLDSDRAREACRTVG